MLSLMLGWLLDDRPVESQHNDNGEITVMGRTDLLRMLEGETVGSEISKDALREAYAEEGADPGTGRAMSPDKIRMFEELRNATTTQQKVAIRTRYARKAAEVNDG